MNPMQLFYIFWFIVLPIIGILALALVPLVWRFIVPEIARRLTWARFGKCDVLDLSDDSGWTDLIVSRQGLPEGVKYDPETKTWRLLPSPPYEKKGKKRKKGKPEDRALQERAKEIILKKSMLRGLGKPIYRGYVGQIELINSSTAAALSSSPSLGSNPSISLENVDLSIGKLKDFAKSLGEHIKKPLLAQVESVESALKIVENSINEKKDAKKIKYYDPKAAIKENLPQMFTPSQISALARNREEYGRESAGKQYGKLIIGMGFIVALIIIALVLVMGLK